jgi:protein-disulfide isomerase
MNVPAAAHCGSVSRPTLILALRGAAFRRCAILPGEEVDPMPSVPGPRLTIPVGPRDHARGPVTAPITLVEYGDFDCPHCGEAYPIVAELQRVFSDRLRFVFRSFPLTNVHPNAQRAAEAAEWAASHGAFWPMHDALFEHQRHLSEAHILDIAKGLGLSAPGLARDWAAHTFFRRVKDDFMSGLESGVRGTPSFFINGLWHDGAWDLATLTTALESAADSG